MAEIVDPDYAPVPRARPPSAPPRDPAPALPPATEVGPGVVAAPGGDHPWLSGIWEYLKRNVHAPEGRGVPHPPFFGAPPTTPKATDPGMRGMDAPVPPARPFPDPGGRTFTDPMLVPGEGWRRREIRPDRTLGREWESDRPNRPGEPITREQREEEFREGGGSTARPLTSTGQPRKDVPSTPGRRTPDPIPLDPATGAPARPSGREGGEHRGGAPDRYGGRYAGEGIPSQIEQLLGLILGRRASPFIEFLHRMNAGHSDPVAGGVSRETSGPMSPERRRMMDYRQSVIDSLSKIDPRIANYLKAHPELIPAIPEDVASGDHISPGPVSDGAPVAPGPDDRRGDTSGPDTGPGEAPVAQTGAPDATTAPVDTGASPTPGVSAEPTTGWNPFSGLLENSPALIGADPATYGRGLRTPRADHGGTSDIPAAGPAGVGLPPLPPTTHAALPTPTSGSTAAPAAAPAPGLAPLGGGYTSKGALGPIGRAREAQEGAVMTAALGENFGQAMNPSLAADRARYRQELASDPGLRQRLLAIMYNEQGRHPQGVQAIAESALNRASVRGTSLRRQLGWHRREPHGYYQVGNMGRGMTPHLRILNQALENALNGSNISNFATDNSSGGLASRERASGRFRFRAGYTGESFFAPGHGEPGFSRNWDRWVAGMQQPELVQR